MTTEKLDLQTPDLVKENIEKIADMFPNCVTEGTTGKVIDFDLLKQELSLEVIDGSKERYRLEWPGKREAIVTANMPTTKTLRPDIKESVDFENTQNIYIEGDNLEVLKLFQESYFNKIKMIYIDPPYNTGKDFIYKDNFSIESETYKEESGQSDELKNRLVANPETSGKYHSDWLSMMYPRIKLARNLLKHEGVIFISINDKELHNLRKICDEIFSEKNFLACLIWNSEGNTDNQLEIKINHEYILCYLKDINYKSEAIGNVIDPNTREDSNLHQGFVDNNINKNSSANPPDIIELPIGFPSSEENLVYQKKNLDKDFFEITRKEKYISDAIKKKYDIENLSGLPVKIDNMIISNFKLQKPCRIYGGFANRNKLKEFIDNDLKPVIEDDSPISFYINANAAVRYKKENVVPRNILSVLRNLGTTEKSKTYLKKLGIPFSYPKPIDLITYLIKVGCRENNEIILDFFAGSCSTAHAVLQLNAEDYGTRKFIMVQLPEIIHENNIENISGYNTICELGRDRIRKAAAKIQTDTNAMIDLGFKAFKLSESNMKDVYHKPQNYNQSSLDLFTDNVKSDRTAEDLLTQVMLDLGLPLSLKIDITSVGGKKVFTIDDKTLFACFDSGIDEAFAKAIAKESPLQIVFRDNSFKDDTAKINVQQLLKQLSPDTQMKVI